MRGAFSGSNRGESQNIRRGCQEARLEGLSQISKFPEEGEVVVGTITRVETYGFYVQLDEYGNLEGFVPVKEVPSNVARNITRVLKPKQKVILKVIYSNPRRFQVDLSLKRVTNDERRKKMIQFKQETKASKILEIARAQTNIKDDAIREEIVKKFGSLYRGLEELVKSPEEFKKKVELVTLIGDDKKANLYLRKLSELAREKIKPKKVSVSGTIKAYAPGPNGVVILRQAFSKALSEINKQRNGINAKITYIGSPRYRVLLEGENYKQLESALSKLVDILHSEIKPHGHFEFERERRR
jgi:translation initiation factor 2 subunit 1